MWALLLVPLLFACSSKPSARHFTCSKVASNGPWRECYPGMRSCHDAGGCFDREAVYCFRAVFNRYDGKPPSQFSICTPTERECIEWNEDRKTVANHSVGPCVLSRADEYVEIPE